MFYTENSMFNGHEFTNDFYLYIICFANFEFFKCYKTILLYSRESLLKLTIIANLLFDTFK
jgi:hypothetical protein